MWSRGRPTQRDRSRVDSSLGHCRVDRNFDIRRAQHFLVFALNAYPLPISGCEDVDAVLLISGRTVPGNLPVRMQSAIQVADTCLERIVAEVCEWQQAKAWLAGSDVRIFVLASSSNGNDVDLKQRCRPQAESRAAVADSPEDVIHRVPQCSRVAAAARRAAPRRPGPAPSPHGPCAEEQPALDASCEGGTRMNCVCVSARSVST